MALVFLPAADIPTFVGEGRIDVGITGRDQVAEHDKVISSGDNTGWEEVLELGFGACKLQVQVPEEGEIKDVRQLVGKHVATSFVNLTEDFFAKLEQKDGPYGTVTDGSQPERGLKTRITFISGSVETACALGVADAVVDLVGTFEPSRIVSRNVVGSRHGRIWQYHESGGFESNCDDHGKHRDSDQVQESVESLPGRADRITD